MYSHEDAGQFMVFTIHVKIVALWLKNNTEHHINPQTF